MDKRKSLEFLILDISILRNDDIQVRDMILSINTVKQQEVKINRSTLWHQQKKIKEGKPLKVYNKAMVTIQ
ncbi:MAG: hypothetical protein ACYCSG_02770 [Thermoplasmataceae archaeon]